MERKAFKNTLLAIDVFVDLIVLLSSNSVQTAYRENGVSYCSNSFMKRIFPGAYMNW